MEKIGCWIRVQAKDGWREGKGVFYPMRYSQREWGGIIHTPEGISAEERYWLYCSSELLADSDYGSEIVQGNDRFLLVWKDRYDCRWGRYTKACLRRMTEEQEDE